MHFVTNSLPLCFAGSPLCFSRAPTWVTVDKRKWRWTKRRRWRAPLSLRSGKMWGVTGAGPSPSLPLSSARPRSWPGWSKSTRRSWRRSLRSRGCNLKPSLCLTLRKTLPQSEVKKPFTQANGSAAFTMDNESDDSQEWKEYSQAAHGNGNGVKTSEDFRPGRLEGEALHYCAERDDQQNHAVLVMQMDQVRVRFLHVVTTTAKHSNTSVHFSNWTQPCSPAEPVFPWEVLLDLPVRSCRSHGLHYRRGPAVVSTLLPRLTLSTDHAVQ